MKNSLLGFVVLVLASLLVGPIQAGKPSKGPSYKFFLLDDLGGLATGIVPNDVNNSGQVVGQINDPVNGFAAACWITNLENGDSQLHLLADGSGAMSINAHGEIVGGQIEIDGNVIGRYWRSHTEDAPLRLLPLQGDEESAAYGLNSDGLVCGYSLHRVLGPDPRPGGDPTQIVTLKEEKHPVVWRIVDDNVLGPFELPNLLDMDPSAVPDNAYGSAISVNDSDSAGFVTVVGGFMQSSQWTDAVRWTIHFDETGQLLSTAEVVAPGALAHDVNDDDVICGRITVSDPSPLAAVWSPEEEILNRPQNVYMTAAYEVSADGLIVGEGWVDGPTFKDGGYHAAMWPSSTSQMIDLNDFVGRKSSVGVLYVAEAVNDNSVIVGRAQNGGFLALPE